MMMDYTAGQGRPAGSMVGNEQGKAFSVNPNKTRPQNIGGVSMHVSSGAPHVLLFERDQQFATLLTSELQLVGYECHTARTAVEVFDAIARYPIRLVLVNLAQAAAARREFWVALDTQRRGRGVQVMTFYCSNLAGYGPMSDDPDDRSHTMLADIEVDGMLGIMNMVNAIRSRTTISNSDTLSRTGSNSGIESGTQGPVNGGNTGEAQKVSQTTMPLPATPTTNGASPRRRATPVPTPHPLSPQPVNVGDSARAIPASSANPANHTDKIRAVMYPNQRSWSAPRDTENAVNSANSANPTAYVSSSSPSHSLNAANTTNTAASTDAVVDRRAGNEQTTRQQTSPEPKESGLAQLSRLVQEHRAPLVDTTRSIYPVQEASSAALLASQASLLTENTMPQPRVRPASSSSISSQSLRASPIEDLPVERSASSSRGSSGESNSAVRYDSASGIYGTQPVTAYSPASNLASIAIPNQASQPAAILEPDVQDEFVSYNEAQRTPTERGEASGNHEEFANEILQSGIGQKQELQERQEPFLAEQMQPMIEEHTQQQPTETSVMSITPATSVQEHAGSSGSNALLDLMQTQVQQRAEAATVKPTSDNALLLDIMQSLPPMPAPSPQPQALTGRATRSLGSVLLEGHLVPQDRLEVALGIQRMLRGVDMNYQLGEILLMFKLLTPDQLLAASLVSYGLITTAQISALGRIRQELHSIGLEYDLENLLILFRILTSEQLREVRSAWAS